MVTERPFDPGLDTPADNQPGAGHPVPGSPYVQDATNRETSDQRLAEIADAESRRVAADQESGRRDETDSGSAKRRR